MHAARIDSPLRIRFSLGILVIALSSGCGGDDGPTDAGQGPVGPVQVTTTGGGRPTVSPDGGFIAYRYPGGGIARISSNGGAPETLVTSGLEPDWSRNGDLIVYRNDVGLVTVNAASRDTAVIRTDGFDSGESWSPDGSEIAVHRTSPGDGLNLIAYPSGDITMLTCLEPDSSACAGEGPTWSPDGEWIAYSDAGEIQKIQHSGGLGVAVGIGYEPAWSPNGQWIAVEKEDSTFANVHIWVIDARGSDLGLWQVTAGDHVDTRPAWSPDSRTIYFSSDRSGEAQIWKVEFRP